MSDQSKKIGDEKITFKNSMTVPNVLSMFRLILIPFIAVLYLKGQFLWSFVLVVVSGLTDTLDGTIARKFNQISTLGKLLDPLADKLTMITLVVCLCIRHNEIIFLAVVIVAKELLMLSGSVYLLKKGARPSASKIWGKLATLVLYIVIGIVIIEDILYSFGVNFVLLPQPVLIIICVIACVFVIMALMQYVGVFWQITRGNYDFENEKVENDEK